MSEMARTVMGHLARSIEANDSGDAVTAQTELDTARTELNASYNSSMGAIRHVLKINGVRTINELFDKLAAGEGSPEVYDETIRIVGTP